MIRHVIAPSRRFTKASHDVVRHPRLTSDAKVLLLYVQGLPDEQSEKPLSELARQLGITGRAYQKTKQLLLGHGFLHEQRRQGDRGLWTTAQLLSNVPLTAEEVTGIRTSEGAPAALPVPPMPPGVQAPVVGAPADRAVGRQLPVDEEREKNYPRPPSEAEPEPGPPPPPPPESSPERAPEPEPEPEPESAEVVEGEKVLLSLRHVRRELYLGAKEARGLAALAGQWLLRGITAAQLRQVLTSELPEGGVRSAVGFLRYRLVHKMPEEARRPEPRPDPRAEALRVAPLIACAGPGDDHVFRALDGETHCGDCRREEAVRQWQARRAREALLPADRSWRERFAAVAATAGDPC
ncbi:hypothetical protein ACH4LT_13600 [Streptomyces clavifer]|uniref:hypothetical protein n=1 Tax=Streptomyces clavifer TaxID=68188 RepID=UPI003798876B